MAHMAVHAHGKEKRANQILKKGLKLSKIGLGTLKDYKGRL